MLCYYEEVQHKRRLNNMAKIKEKIKIVNKYFKPKLIISGFVSFVNSQRKTVLINC
jgi:hypothetical protein